MKIILQKHGGYVQICILLSPTCFLAVFHQLGPAPCATKLGSPGVGLFARFIHLDTGTLDPGFTDLLSLFSCHWPLIQTTNFPAIGPANVPLRGAGHVVTHPPTAYEDLPRQRAI